MPESNEPTHDMAVPKSRDPYPYPGKADLEAKFQELQNKAGFQNELTKLINRYSQENNSGTPDFVLAQYIQNSLNAFNLAVNEREKWYGRTQDRFGMPTGASND